MLTIPMEKLFYIVEKAREFDAEVPGDVDDTVSSATDDDEREILLDTPKNTTVQELREAIGGLNVDELDELLALTWLGRGDFDARNWDEALAQARQTRNETELNYLIGTPLLADYLEEAVNALGLSFEEFERNRL